MYNKRYEWSAQIESFLLQIKKICQDHILFSSIPGSGKAPNFNGHLYDHSLLTFIYIAIQNKT